MSAYFDNMFYASYDIDETTADAPTISNVRWDSDGNRKVHPFDSPRLLIPYLSQDKVWCDRYLVYVPVEHMENSHALNAARLLIKRAHDLRFAAELCEQNVGIVIGEHSDEEWISAFPLFVALAARAQENCGREKYPWEK